jgi:hypothetical protein
VHFVTVEAPIISRGDFVGVAVYRISDEDAFAIVLPSRELERSAFVAFSPKNGLHRASRRPAGRSCVQADQRAIQ